MEWIKMTDFMVYGWYLLSFNSTNTGHAALFTVSVKSLKVKFICRNVMHFVYVLKHPVTHPWFCDSICPGEWFF